MSSTESRTLPLAYVCHNVWRVKCDGSAVHLIVAESDLTKEALCGTKPTPRTVELTISLFPEVSAKVDRKRTETPNWTRVAGLQDTCQACQVEAAKARYLVEEKT